jgi:hypothetical protein
MSIQNNHFLPQIKFFLELFQVEGMRDGSRNIIFKWQQLFHRPL